MNKKFMMPILVAAGVALSALSLNAAAQSKAGYWTQPGGGNAVWKNGYGQCWRAGYWTPALAIEECDPVMKKAEPKRMTPPPAKPKPRPVAQKITLAADVLFDFDKSVIKPAGKSTLDGLVDRIKRINLEVVIAIGHTDSIGSDAYNQKLSVRRANAVKAYLVSKGIPANRVYTEGKGEKQPVASNKTKSGRAKNRRVELEVIGTQK